MSWLRRKKEEKEEAPPKEPELYNNNFRDALGNPLQRSRYYVLVPREEDSFRGCIDYRETVRDLERLCVVTDCKEYDPPIHWSSVSFGDRKQTSFLELYFVLPTSLIYRSERVNDYSTHGPHGQARFHGYEEDGDYAKSIAKRLLQVPNDRASELAKRLERASRGLSKTLSRIKEERKL